MIKPCISQVTTLKASFEDDLAAYGRAGWSAVELWLTKLEQYLQDHPIAEARRLLEDHGLRAVAAASQGGLLTAQGEESEAHWSQYRRRLELIKELGVATLVVTADFVRGPGPEEVRRAVDRLRDAARLAQAHGVRLALEFQKSARFCASLDTALALVAQSEAEGLGVCLDLFHYYTGPSKFEDLAYLSPEVLAWVQLCDLCGTPREVANDSDRILPGEGDFQIGPILDHLDRIGYDGYASLEVLNPQLWQVPVDRVAEVGYQAMARVLEGVGRGPASRGGQ